MEKTNKIKVRIVLSNYYKDEADKTIYEIVLRLIDKELESRFLNDESSKQNNSTLL